MRTECINHQYGFDKPMPVTRLMDHVSNSRRTVQSSFCFIRKENIYFRMSSSNATLWSSAIWRWFSHGWLRCMSKGKIVFILFLFFEINRKKARICINYVHQLTTIHANQWLLVLVLNRHEHI